MRRAKFCIQLFLLFLVVSFFPAQFSGQGTQTAPSPLWSANHPVDWWFAFKFNAETFPRPTTSVPACMFGGTPGGTRKYTRIGQSYVAASSEHAALAKGPGYLGDSLADPVGATFDEVYNGDLSYIVWNDQFYRSPVLACEGSSAVECGAKWGHSKGMLAWNDDGNGFILQVTTPSWPGAGNSANPRAGDGNSLGCVNDDDVDLSQGFFALKLTKDDLLKVLAALQTEGAVTDPSNPQIAKIGGPQEAKDAAAKLGSPNTTSTFTQATLSSGVQVIAKAGGLAAPPWQFVSAVLGKVPLRVATFWQGALIYSTPGRTKPDCWPTALQSLSPGTVQIVKTGIWDGTTIGLTGTSQKDASGNSLGANHAKIGVSTGSGSPLTIFADMNQDGAISPVGKLTCSSSQNARGGLFFVVENEDLHKSVTALLTGKYAPSKAPAATRTAGTTSAATH
ncbi:deoxyribonuclease II [Terriglobus saanensis]|uniref:Deoxyribonuclease II n=1 Tax=Terriglobus saanensis (strain ATCC BAA-1853 / DSM 23119 / SP1PR4) TaxID=401053 RepID=E8V6J7_TERSS|nr:deoxyribonuclease II [Terriglobus saanensis]ADV82736.1 deoxyribonuclease II [Terriglobus saanensis SP1PR4]